MEIREIMGNAIVTPVPKSDWLQDNPAKPDYIANKPVIGAYTYLVNVTLKEADGDTTVIRLENVLNLDGRKLQKNDILLDANGNTAVVTTGYDDYAEYKLKFSIVSDNGSSGDSGESDIPEDIETELDNIKDQVSDATEVAEQAKEIANQAKADAADALASITATKTELEESIEEILGSIENAQSEIDATKTELITTKEELQTGVDQTYEELTQTKNELEATFNTFQSALDTAEGSIKETANELKNLIDGMEEITSWSDGERSGIAGFVAKADENSTLIADITVWQNETDTAFASISQEVSANKANIHNIAQIQTTTTSNLAGIQAEVTDQYATISTLTEAVGENATAIAGVKQYADDTFATIESIASLETASAEAIAGLRTEVAETYATNEMLAALETETSTAMAAFEQEVESEYAKQTVVTALDENLALFKQEVKKDYVTLDMVSSWEGGDDSAALAAFKQEVANNYATQQMLSTVSDNLANFEQEVTDTYATQQMLTAVDNALTSFKQEANSNYAQQSAVTALNESFTQYQQTVTDTYATQEMISAVEESLAEFEQTVESNYASQSMVTSVENALSSYKQEVSENYAKSTEINSLRTETTNAIAASEDKATSTYASKSELTAFETTTSTNLARIEQKSDADSTYIQSTVANLDKYSVGPKSPSYGFTTEQAKEILTKGTIYVATASSEEGPYSFDQYFYYTWNGAGWTKGERVNSTYDRYVEIGSNPDGTLWYISQEITPIYHEGTGRTYVGNTLYKVESGQWIAVASLAGNSQSRAISSVKQTTNSIEQSVSDLAGNYAGTVIQVNENKASIQDIATWKGTTGESLVTFMQEAGDNFASAAQVAQIVDKDGNIKEAAIVTAVNNNLSEINLTADHINFEGSQFSSTMTGAISAAKDEAIEEANQNVEDRLKDYSTTAQTQSLIDQKADSIALSVSQTYSTKTDTENAKNDAIEAFETELENYSTTEQMNSALDLKADSATLSAYAKTESLTNYATNDSVADALEDYTTTSDLNDRLESFATKSDMNSALALKADEASLSTYAKTSTLANYATKDNVTDTLKDYTSKEDLDDTLSSYATISDMTSRLALKADSATLKTYAKTADLASYATNDDVNSQLGQYVKTTEMESALSLKADSATLSVYAYESDTQDRFEEVEGKLALEIKEENSKKYAYLNASVDSIKFDATKTIEINATNFTLDKDGNIDATSGTIGGFTLRNNVLYYNGKNEIDKVFDGGDGGIYIGPDGISVGGGEDSDGHGGVYYPQVILTYDGKITANNAEITGGTIGGFTIRNSAISSGQKTSSMDIANVNSKYYPGIYLGPLGFSVHSNTTYNDGTSSICYNGVTIDADSGKLTANLADISGKITASEGKIGGFTIGSTSLSTGTEGTSSYVYLGTSVKTKTINGNSGSMCFILGTNFGLTKAGKMYANSGYIGPWTISSDYIEASFTGYSQGNYSDSYTGKVQLGKSGLKLNDSDQSCYTHLRPRGTTFYSPKKANASGYMNLAKWLDISSSSITLTLGTSGDTTDVGSIHFGRGSETSVVGTQITTDERNFVISSGGTSITGYLLGNWTFNKAPSTASDKNYKNTILDFTAEYDVFFDSLRPRTYKYNYGNSGRTHFGFIAQEVAQSAINSGIDLQNIAAVCQPDTEVGCWRIRYEEFISLNTLQIQKLKVRVTELENTIAQLISNK